MQSLQAQNAVTPAGVIEAGPERISVRTSGQFASEEDLKKVNLRLNDRFYRLTDIADISRGYTEPPAPMFRFNGQDAVGLAIAFNATPAASAAAHVEAEGGDLRAVVPLLSTWLDTPHQPPRR